MKGNSMTARYRIVGETEEEEKLYREKIRGAYKLGDLFSQSANLSRKLFTLFPTSN